MEKLNLIPLSEIPAMDQIDLITESEDLLKALQENIVRQSLKELTETEDWIKRAAIIDNMNTLLELLKGDTPDYLFQADELLKYIDTTYLYTDAEHQTLYNVIIVC
jgi:hypothetical protein